MRKLALLSVLSALLLAAAAAAAAMDGGSKRLPTSGTVWAVERFDGGQNTLAAFDAATGSVLGVVPSESVRSASLPRTARARSTRPTSAAIS
jgi:hypothetical protein